MQQYFEDSEGNHLTLIPSIPAYSVTLEIRAADGELAEITLSGSDLADVGDYLKKYAVFGERVSKKQA